MKSSPAFLLIATFALGFALPNSLAPFLGANVTSDYDKISSLTDTVTTFHTEMNDITNDFIEVLVESEDPNVEFPGSPEGCEDNNVSTYCLAVRLNDELLAFETSLINRKDEFDFDPSNSVDSQLLEAISTSTQKQGAIEDEIESARDTLDLTLEVYNQLQTVYPIHKEFELLAQNLGDYRDNLGKIRRVIDQYPSKFHDATTLQCQ